jgi:hypothetical protein
MRRRRGVPLPLQFAIGTVVLLTLASHGQSLANVATDSALPNAPSALLSIADDPQQQKMPGAPTLPPPCPISLRPSWIKTQSKPKPQPDPANKIPTSPGTNGVAASAPPAAAPLPCTVEHPFRIVVDYEVRQPLTAQQKAYLALHDVTQPFNLLVIGAEAGIGVGANSHSAYGPGFKGFGRLYGYQLLQDAQGEFFGTFLIPALTHEDPRYRRMQHATVKRRILHALERTVIAQHDDGSPMPNYATLLTYPISAELSNLYVPGIQGNAPDTARRIAIGFATDPVSNLIAEFLPDFARRIHVRSVFVQQIVNNVALQGVGTPP